MSPTATAPGVIRGFVIALFSDLYFVILSGHERRAIDLHSERTVNYNATKCVIFGTRARGGTPCPLSPECESLEVEEEAKCVLSD